MHGPFRNFCVAGFSILFFGHALSVQNDARCFDDKQFRSQVVPILKKLCYDCHSDELEEADINLETWTTTSKVVGDIRSLVKLDAIIRTRQMPPKDSPQPSEKELNILSQWSSKLLAKQAAKYAGDPGPVVLRRLSNAEYNYSVQDLTGLNKLNPTRHFPVDGAAGEGFTNTGHALGMSPSLFQKYLEAGKTIAAHAMLLDDRIEFTHETTSRDRADLLISKIQNLYDRYTTDQGGTAVNLQGIKFDTNTGGRLPIEKYLVATIKHREAIAAGQLSLAKVAHDYHLSPKYLKNFWEAMVASKGESSFLLEHIRRRWRESTINNVNDLASEIQQWQNALWKFNTIGHIGRPGGAKSWMQGINPQITRQEFRINLPDLSAQQNINVYLSSQNILGKQNSHVIWESARLTGGLNGDIYLRDLKSLVANQEAIRTQALSQTKKFLAAADEIQRKSKSLNVQESRKLVLNVASKNNVDPKHLQVWLNYLGIRGAMPVKVTGHLKANFKNSGNGYDFIQGWGSHATPSISANSSDQTVRIPGIAKPNSILVHPSPTLYAGIAWQSPASGPFELNAEIADHHPECGNGVEWILIHRSPRLSTVIWKGEIPLAGKSEMPVKKIQVEEGDLVALYVGPRQGSHACDLTQVNLNLKNLKTKQSWNLAKDLSPDILQANPHADSHGNKDVWHLFKGNWSDVNKEVSHSLQVPLNSELRTWIDSDDAAARAQSATKIQQWLDQPVKLDGPNSQLIQQIRRLMDPYQSELLRRKLSVDPRFGKHPDGTPLDNRHLVTKTSDTVEFNIPTQLAKGRQLVVSAVVHSRSPISPVQAFVQLSPPTTKSIISNQPILVANGSQSQELANKVFGEFRELFPAALCYKKIVPIDEVVTLTLFYREDQFLREKFLSPAEARYLDGLWNDLIFVTQEPLKKVVALEQIYQFATQDRPDLVKEFKTLFEPTQQKAALFRTRLKKAESVHLKEVHRLAGLAWRRQVLQKDTKVLDDFYRQIRKQEIGHDKAIRLTIARIFASPDFLYRREVSHPGNHYSPVNNIELANRLSYFLWSSAPDQELKKAAVQNNLTHSSELLQQSKRMLDSPKIRRLAIHFACQWLHLRDFDNNNDKNEKLFPEFANLRKDMYQETVLFFEDLFRNNRSVLEIIDSNYVFANKDLAAHYGLDLDQLKNANSESKSFPFLDGTWKRIKGIKSNGRGGVLGMATFLASQSGASRTSPILRGNWVSETLLGEKLPKPPKNVPQLPEKIPSGLTARQLIEQHSSNAACAKCHARIDPYGFALEQFDPLGRTRKTYVDTKTQLVDGERIEGIQGLKNYLLTKRKDDFLKQFCRKLLGYSLGRETQLSDGPLIQEMISNLKSNDYKVHSAIETILTSEQFLNVRDQDYQRED